MFCSLILVVFSFLLIPEFAAQEEVGSEVRLSSPSPPLGFGTLPSFQPRRAPRGPVVWGGFPPLHIRAMLILISFQSPAWGAKNNLDHLNHTTQCTQSRLMTRLFILGAFSPPGRDGWRPNVSLPISFLPLFICIVLWGSGIWGSRTTYYFIFNLTAAAAAAATEKCSSLRALCSLVAGKKKTRRKGFAERTTERRGVYFTKHSREKS